MRILHIPAAIGDGYGGGSTDPEKDGNSVNQMLEKRGFVRNSDGIFRPKPI